MTSFGRSGLGFAGALVAATLGSVSPLHAQSAPYPSTYPYPYQPSPLRLTLRGSRPDLNYRIQVRDEERGFEDERPDVGSCSGDCSLVLWPGRYQLHVEPPSGSGLRVARRDLELRRDTSVYVEPGNRLARGLGMGLTIAGGCVLGIGFAVVAMSGGLEGRDTGDQIAIVSILGTAALATAGGITLLVIGRNRITVDPPPLRSAGSKPVMLSLRAEL